MRKMKILRTKFRFYPNLSKLFTIDTRDYKIELFNINILESFQCQWFVFTEKVSVPFHDLSIFIWKDSGGQIEEVTIYNCVKKQFIVANFECLSRRILNISSFNALIHSASKGLRNNSFKNLKDTTASSPSWHSTYLFSEKSELCLP